MAIKEYDLHKDLLRSIRFELDKDFGLNGCKILGITSISDGVGKSFLLQFGLCFCKNQSKSPTYIGKMNLRSNEEKNKRIIPHQTFEKFLMKREIQIEDFITV